MHTEAAREIIIESVGIGLVISLLFTETLGLAAGGMVVPGCIATRPLSIGIENGGEIELDIAEARPSGFALCRRIKEDPAVQHVPVLLFSMRVEGPKYEAFAAEVGADRFLPKGSTLEDLANALAEAAPPPPLAPESSAMPPVPRSMPTLPRVLPTPPISGRLSRRTDVAALFLAHLEQVDIDARLVAVPDPVDRTEPEPRNQSQAPRVRPEHRREEHALPHLDERDPEAGLKEVAERRGVVERDVDAGGVRRPAVVAHRAVDLARRVHRPDRSEGRCDRQVRPLREPVEVLGGHDADDQGWPPFIWAAMNSASEP